MMLTAQHESEGSDAGWMLDVVSDAGVMRIDQQLILLGVIASGAIG